MCSSAASRVSVFHDCRGIGPLWGGEVLAQGKQREQDRCQLQQPLSRVTSAAVESLALERAAPVKGQYRKSRLVLTLECKGFGLPSCLGLSSTVMNCGRNVGCWF